MPKKAARYKFRVKNGYVEIRVVLVKGQLPRYFTGKTYEEAEAKADEVVRLAAKDISTDRGDWAYRPFGEWVDYWLDSVQRPKLQPTTFNLYESQFRLYVKPHPLCARKLRDIRYGDIETWRDWLESAPALGVAAWQAVRKVNYQGVLQPKSIQEVEQIARLAGDTKPLSGITRRDIFSRLSTCLRFALHRRYIGFNPCETVTRPSVGAVRKKAAPRSETIGRLLRQIESERWGAAVVIAVTAGLRKGEVLALRWEDIEWKAAFPDFGEVTIGRQVQRLGRGIGLLVRDVVKTDASDAVRPLPPAALAALERRRKEQSAEILRAPKVQAGDKAEYDKYYWRGDDIRPGKAGFIFTSDVGTVVDPRNWRCPALTDGSGRDDQAAAFRPW